MSGISPEQAGKARADNGRRTLHIEGAAVAAPGTSIRDAVRILRSTRKGAVLCEDDVGGLKIVSQKDIIVSVLYQRDSAWDDPVGTIGTPNPICVDAANPPANLLKLAAGPYRHLPIVRREGDQTLVLGMIARRELLPYVADLCCFETETGSAAQPADRTEQQPSVNLPAASPPSADLGLPLFQLPADLRIDTSKPRKVCSVMDPVEKLRSKGRIVGCSVSFAEVCEMLSRPRTRQLYVLSGDVVIGIITEHDVLTRGEEGSLSPDDPAVEFMTKSLQVVSANDQARNALRILESLRVSQVPVIGNSRFVGAVTVYHLLNLTADLLDASEDSR